MCIRCGSRLLPGQGGRSGWTRPSWRRRGSLRCPVCQKYLPESIELRQGVQLGAGTIRIEEERAFVCDPVEVGGFDEFVDCAFAGLVAVGAGIPAPVVGECENDVWSQDFPPSSYSCVLLSGLPLGLSSSRHADAPHTIWQCCETVNRLNTPAIRTRLRTALSRGWRANACFRRAIRRRRGLHRVAARTLAGTLLCAGRPALSALR